MHVFRKDNFLRSDLILQMSLKEPSQPRNRSKISEPAHMVYPPINGQILYLKQW